jgi:hypothetical protein
MTSGSDSQDGGADRSAPRADLVLGYVSSPRDYAYLDAALRHAGNPPSVVLIPASGHTSPMKKVKQWGAKVLYLPADPHEIAHAVRTELTALPAPRTDP